MKKFLALAMTVFLAVPTQAGTVTNATIVNYFIIKEGKLFFGTSSYTGMASCAIYGWAVDLTGTYAIAGKAMLAAVIEAHSTGRTVNVYGSGKCDVWGDRETVDGIVVN